MMSRNSSSESQAYLYLWQEVFGLRDILFDGLASAVTQEDSSAEREDLQLGSEVWLWVTSRQVLELAVFERMNAAILQEASKRGLQLKIAWIDEEWWKSHLPQELSVGCVVFTDGGLVDLYKQTLGDHPELVVEALPSPMSYEAKPRLKSVAWKRVQFILSRWSGS
ncbi:MAG: hypothetical protein N2Z70_04115 [Bdellovibrionaceae bacterium]|jgi:hypothetical protein|nr:hypothetical protein [Pseudobdellovibrionaceae bacterium]